MAYRLIVSTAAVVGTGIRVLDTIPDLEMGLGAWARWLEFAVTVVLTADLIAHSINAALTRGPSKAAGLFDYLREFPAASSICWRRCPIGSGRSGRFRSTSGRLSGWSASSNLHAIRRRWQRSNR